VWNKKASGKGKDLRDLSRPMTRLRLEANKVKEVLSANSEYPIKAEQLHADVDLVTKITRLEFEEACQVRRSSPFVHCKSLVSDLRICLRVSLTPSTARWPWLT